MKYVIISRDGDQEQIEVYLKRFCEYSDSELVKAYNAQAKLGITGVHQQALYLIAMHREFLFRFGGSPIEFDNFGVLELNNTLSSKHNGIDLKDF